MQAFDRYLKYLCEVLGHADRHAGFVDYSRGLMLPIERKSVEPLAAHLDPWHVSAKHQALHHFVAKSEWLDEAVLARVREWVAPRLDLQSGCYWIVDDVGFPKKGRCSVGVARQYCGQLGKQDNCQVAVSLSLASEKGSLPIAWRLYLHEEWAQDRARCAKAGVPAALAFATKPDIALAQIRAAPAAGVPNGIVLADAGYGNETSFRDALTASGLAYCVGVQSSTTVWPPGGEPLPPPPRKRLDRPPTLLLRGSGHEPVSVKRLAEQWPTEAWQPVTWREGSNTALTSRFAAVRVRAAHRDPWRASLRDEEWLLIEWPAGEAEPAKYWLATLPAETPLARLVHVAKMRWRIERDYHELKQQFGLGHYEGRGWRGFHHHATLCIAVYGFLMAWRLEHGGEGRRPFRATAPALPEGYTPRGRRPNAAPCAGLDSDIALSARSRDRATPGALSLLRRHSGEFVTQ
jgi:SRSO17 transposase